PGGNWREPLFYAETVHVGLDWRRLLHGDVVARARIFEPKIIVVAPARAGAKAAPKTPDLSAELPKVTPLDVDRVEIVRGELLFRDAALPRHPEVWVHRLQLAAENMATRRKLAKGRPTTLSARGVLGRSGKLDMFVSADAFASPLAFAGRFE